MLILMLFNLFGFLSPFLFAESITIANDPALMRHPGAQD